MKNINKKNFEIIQKQYNVPAKKGGHIFYFDGTNFLKGIIINSDGQYLFVKFNKFKKPLKLHPKWNIIYLNKV